MVIISHQPDMQPLECLWNHHQPLLTIDITLLTLSMVNVDIDSWFPWTLAWSTPVTIINTSENRTTVHSNGILGLRWLVLSMNADRGILPCSTVRASTHCAPSRITGLVDGKIDGQETLVTSIIGASWRFSHQAFLGREDWKAWHLRGTSTQQCLHIVASQVHLDPECIWEEQFNPKRTLQRRFNSDNLETVNHISPFRSINYDTTSWT